MTQVSFATHEVLNQSPPFWDVDLFAIDRPLADAVAANGGTSAQQELSEFGQHWGSAAMAERGRLANENTPKLRTFDSRGNRRDEIDGILVQEMIEPGVEFVLGMTYDAEFGPLVVCGAGG